MKILEEEVKSNRRTGRGGGGRWRKEASARRLAASLWQLAATNSSGDVRWRCGLSDRLGFEFCSPSPIPKYTTEGATKWDYYHSTKPEDINNFKLLQDQANIENPSPVSDKQTFKPPKSGKKTKPEKGFWSSTRLIKYCMKKLDKEEGTSWMITELLQMFVIIKLLKDNLKRERKRARELYTMNSKLLSDISETKSLATKFMHDYEKEKKAHEFLQGVCNEQREKIKAHEEEIRELRSECGRIQAEVEQERKMLQIAESWREERAHMKLMDAKSVLEDKFREMNECIADLKVILRSSDVEGIEDVLNKIKYQKSDEDDELKDQTSDIVEESKKVDLGEYSSLSVYQSRKSRLVSGFGEFCYLKKTRAARRPSRETKAVGKWVGQPDPTTRITVPLWRK